MLLTVAYLSRTTWRRWRRPGTSSSGTAGQDCMTVRAAAASLFALDCVRSDVSLSSLAPSSPRVRKPDDENRPKCSPFHATRPQSSNEPRRAATRREDQLYKGFFRSPSLQPLHHVQRSSIFSECLVVSNDLPLLFAEGGLLVPRTARGASSEGNTIGARLCTVKLFENR